MTAIQQKIVLDYWISLIFHGNRDSNVPFIWRFLISRFYLFEMHALETAFDLKWRKKWISDTCYATHDAYRVVRWIKKKFSTLPYISSFGGHPPTNFGTILRVKNTTFVWLGICDSHKMYRKIVWNQLNGST